MKIILVQTPIGFEAYDDDTYDGPGSLVGSGKTEAEAVQDLQEQIADWEIEEHRKENIHG